MLSLSEADIHRLLAAANMLGQPFASAEFAEQVLGVVAGLVDADYVALTEVDLNEGRASGYLFPYEAWVDEESELFAALTPEHPLITYFQQTGDGRARCVSDFLTEREFHQRDIYQQFYRRLGAEDQLAATFTAGPGTIIGLALNRPARTFSPRDRLVIDLIGPYVAAAHRASAERQHIQQLMEEPAEAPPDLVGVVMVDERGRPSGSFGGIGDELVHEWRSDIADVIGRIRDQRVSEAQLPGDSWPGWELRYVPWAVDGNAAITVRRISKLPLRQAIRALGLSTRQTDVLELVTTGATDQQIGRLLHISTATVRTHIGHIFRKLNVESRTAATALALRSTTPTPDEAPFRG